MYHVPLEGFKLGKRDQGCEGGREGGSGEEKRERTERRDGGEEERGGKEGVEVGQYM